MGNFLTKKEPPPPVVLVPPLFDFPPLSARNRMLDSSYNLLFGKLALKGLFEDYFEEPNRFSTKFLLKPIDDPHVDLVASVSGGQVEGDLVGDAMFRWQSDVDDPHTFVDLAVSTSNPVLMMRSSAYYPKYGVGAFAIYPLISKPTIGKLPDQDGVIGLRYGSTNLSFGATLSPTDEKQELPKSAWLVSKMGKLTVGVQYEPLLGGSKDVSKYTDPKNWSCAAGYGVGSQSPLSPSFNFGLQLARSSQFIASFYQHLVVQRRVKNPFEENEVVGITNYIDLGFELQTSVDGIDSPKPTGSNIPDSSLQMAASWQANKNFLLKGKVGAKSSTLTLAMKSWWKPSFTFNISATTNHRTGNVECGVGLRVDSLSEASYQRADPNFVMLTPNKEHLAEGIVWKMGKRPMFQSDVDAENFSELPRELRPLQKIL